MISYSTILLCGCCNHFVICSQSRHPSEDSNGIDFSHHIFSSLRLYYTLLPFSGTFSLFSFPPPLQISPSSHLTSLQGLRQVMLYSGEPSLTLEVWVNWTPPLPYFSGGCKPVCPQEPFGSPGRQTTEIIINTGLCSKNLTWINSFNPHRCEQ